jgi:hypothetical protein
MEQWIMSCPVTRAIVETMARMYMQAVVARFNRWPL